MKVRPSSSRTASIYTQMNLVCTIDNDDVEAAPKPTDAQSQLLLSDHGAL